MELRDIKELMKILKEEEMAEIKVKYGKIKLVLTNSETLSKEIPQSEKKKVEVIEKIADTPKEEVIKSKNVGEIILERIEKDRYRRFFLCGHFVGENGIYDRRRMGNVCKKIRFEILKRSKKRRRIDHLSYVRHQKQSSKVFRLSDRYFALGSGRRR